MATNTQSIMIKYTLITFIIHIAFAVLACNEADSSLYPDKSYPEVLIKTTAGDITLELDRVRSPITVNNFLRYIKSGSFIKTIFHRVEKNFVIQGGGYTKDFKAISECNKIFNESGNGLKNIKGSIAMARYDDPHSATSQFYFNLKDSPSLDPNKKNWGYTVFGEVIEGMEILMKIANVKTTYSSKLDSANVPIEPIFITEITVQ